MALTNEQQQRRFKRLYITQRDFHECLEYLHELQQKASSGAIKRALLVAAVVSYARPFSQNKDHYEAHSTPKLPLKKLLNKSQIKLDKRLRDIRNEAVAHSSYERYSLNLTVQPPISYTISPRRFELLNEDIDLDEFQRLVDTLQTYVSKELEQIGKDFLKESP